MPRADASGVIVRDAHLQIDLRAQGFGRERLNLAPTPRNIEYAKKLRIEILGKIERGSFVLSEYFPDSPRAAAQPASITFGELAQTWIETRRNRLAHSTAHHYTQTLASKHFKDWTSVPVGTINYLLLQDKLGKLPAHPKTFNNIVTVLRMVLEYAYRGHFLKDPLHESIDWRRVPDADPDPFSLAEVDLILAAIPHDRGRNYFEFAFFTGMRPSELIALRWANVNLLKGEVLVNQAITRSQEKGTKNGKARKVQLNARARAALDRQRLISAHLDEHVFIGLDNRPYTTTDGPLDAFWKPALQVLRGKVRYRDARQTRHTYATVCLHAGSKPAWVARQLGHAMHMFFTVYSTWLDEQDSGNERSRLNAFLESPSGQEST